MSTATTIEITANGKPFQVQEGKRLKEFLSELGFEPGMVIVERNREALTPAETGKAMLRAGDRLEIVQITAGG